jgi:hypothetical protein
MFPIRFLSHVVRKAAACVYAFLTEI